MFTLGSVNIFLFATLGLLLGIYGSLYKLPSICCGFCLDAKDAPGPYIWKWLGIMIKYQTTDIKCSGHFRTLLFPPVTVVTPSNNYSYVFARVLHSLVYFISNSLCLFSYYLVRLTKLVMEPKRHPSVRAGHNVMNR